MQHVRASDREGVSLIVAQMVADLRRKWGTSVLCISLDGQKETIEALIPQEEGLARAYVIDQKNPDCDIIVRKAAGIINRRFVRAVIVSGAGRLKIDGGTSGDTSAALSGLQRLAQNKDIPVILVSLGDPGTENPSRIGVKIQSFENQSINRYSP